MSRNCKIHNDCALFPLYVFAVSTIVVLGTCTGPDSDYEIRLSMVTSVSVPDTVQVGESFIVSIVTGIYIGGDKQGHDDIHTIEGGYRIVPYDLIYVGPGPVDGGVYHFIHKVGLRLDAVGMSNILILHRLRSTTGADSTGTIVRQVVVATGEQEKTD